jgi:hypothetical protein
MAPQVLATFRVIGPLLLLRLRARKGARKDGAVAGFASATRLILDGVLSDANLFGWRWRTVFFLIVPVALVTLAVPAETAGGASGAVQHRAATRRRDRHGAARHDLLRVGDTCTPSRSRRTGRRTRSGAFAMCTTLSLLLPPTQP